MNRVTVGFRQSNVKPKYSYGNWKGEFGRSPPKIATKSIEECSVRYFFVVVCRVVLLCLLVCCALSHRS